MNQKTKVRRKQLMTKIVSLTIAGVMVFGLISMALVAIFAEQ